jgi:hypothetical protein
MAMFDARGKLNSDELLILIADDGQQARRVLDLVQALPSAARIVDQVGKAVRQSELQQYLEILRKGPPSTLPPVKGVERDDDASGIRERFVAVIDNNGDTIPRAPYDLSSKFHLAPGALLLQLDFWTLSTATVFIGNQVSTLSMNVCRYRRANGLACDNFV